LKQELVVKEETLMDKSVDKLLSKYDSTIVKTLEFMIYDMAEYLERNIERDELEERIKYSIDSFQRIR